MGKREKHVRNVTIQAMSTGIKACLMLSVLWRSGTAGGRKIQQCSKNKAKLVRNDELCFECIGAGSCVDVLCGRRLCLQRRLICRGSRRELTIFRTQEAWMIVRRCQLPRLA